MCIDSTYGAGLGVLAARDGLLALLLRRGDGDDGDNRDVGALIQETKTLGALSGTEEVGEEASKETLLNLGEVTGLDGLVAAGELSLVTTLVGGLLGGQLLREREVVLGVSDLLASASARGRRKSGNGSSQSKNSGDGELHCDGGFGFERG